MQKYKFVPFVYTDNKTFIHWLKSTFKNNYIVIQKCNFCLTYLIMQQCHKYNFFHPNLIILNEKLYELNSANNSHRIIFIDFLKIAMLKLLFLYKDCKICNFCYLCLFNNITMQFLSFIFNNIKLLLSIFTPPLLKLYPHFFPQKLKYIVFIVLFIAIK